VLVKKIFITSKECLSSWRCHFLHFVPPQGWWVVVELQLLYFQKRSGKTNNKNEV